MSVDLSALVALAFNVVGTSVGGVTRTVIYRTVGAQAYNPTTGVLTATNTDSTVTAIFTAIKRDKTDIDMQNSRRVTVEMGDQKCLIPYSSLPITPTMEDRIIDGATTWRIIDWKIDPTGKALHTFQLRHG